MGTHTKDGIARTIVDIPTLSKQYPVGDNIVGPWNLTRRAGLEGQGLPILLEPDASPAAGGRREGTNAIVTASPQLGWPNYKTTVPRWQPIIILLMSTPTRASSPLLPPRHRFSANAPFGEFAEDP